MSDFALYFKLGFWHVLDFSAFDHVLFLTALVLPFGIRNWKKLLGLLSTFTVGHTLTLAGSLYGVVSVNEKWVEFLIMLSILLTCCNNIINYNKKKYLLGNYFFSGLFGLIHGMGFSIYLRMLLDGRTEKFLPLLEFALGIEVVQILVVAFIVGVFLVLNNIFTIAKRDWVLLNSAVIIGIILPILIERVPL